MPRTSTRSSPAASKRRGPARVAREEPLHIVLWAHGGLINEAAGLAIAQQQVRWWLDNRVYPIFFVWETGFLDALQQIMSGTRGLPRAPDIWDVTTDLAVEAAARGGGIGKIWGAMKRSAELAAAPEGGARYVAKKLAAFCQARPQFGNPRVVLHAVGHSAGSIFHSHFLPAAFDEGVPGSRGVAPARAGGAHRHLQGDDPAPRRQRDPPPLALHDEARLGRGRFGGTDLSQVAALSGEPRARVRIGLADPRPRDAACAPIRISRSCSVSTANRRRSPTSSGR